MGSLLALLVIVLISLLVVRLGTNALVLTGMSEHAAKFQASSAFFGVGFTTAEAEMIMKSSVRRRIVLHLIIAGNIGLTSALATLIVTLVQGGQDLDFGLWESLLILAVGIVIISVLLNMRWVKKPLDHIMKIGLKSAGVVRAMDYDTLLRVEEGFCISEVKLEEGHPWSEKKLGESRPSDVGVVILNIRRKDGSFTGAPDKGCTLHVGDEIMVYGANDAVDKVAKYSVDQLENGDAE